MYNCTCFTSKNAVLLNRFSHWLKVFFYINEIVFFGIESRSIQKFSAYKGGFTQYPFFLRFRSFFCAFASPWTSMPIFISIFICPYPHQPDSYILDKSFPKKIFCKAVQPYFETSLYRSYTKFLSICSSLLSADMDLQKCAWKSA